jgi:putative glutamine amidotransferase
LHTERKIAHFKACINGKQDEVIHQVKIASGSILDKLIGSECWVNSNHHQAIRDVDTGLTVIATASDGIIEAVQMNDRDFVLAVQWHPEKMLAKSNQMMVLFEQLMKAAIKSQILRT